MPAGLPVAMIMLAQAASAVPADPAPAPLPVAASTYGPPAPAKPKAPAPKPPEQSCATVVATANPREIIVCAPKPQGYRLNPDVMQARREIRSGGRPTPSEKFRNTDCATIGPMGCRGGPTINLVNAAITLATMAKKAVNGENVGKMFVTDPHPSEYQLYLEAKHRREAAEAEKAAKAKAKAAAAADPAGAADSVPR